MAALATADDVAGRWRPLSSDEEDVADTLLEDASSVVRRRIPDVDTRMAADADYARIVVATLVGMVLPVLRNPDGLASRTVGGVTERWEALASQLAATPDFDLLAPGSDAAFTITPYGAPDTSTLDGWA